MSSEKPRRKQYERSAETSLRILDAAQKLFADFGYEGVSMRAVAAKANVNLASIVYYFNSKNGLFDAVLTRYYSVLDQERARLLLLADANPSLEAYVRAYLEPAFKVMTDEKLGGRDFARFLWRLPHEPRALWNETTLHYREEVEKSFLQRIRAVCPNMSETDFAWNIHLTGSIFLATLGKCAEEQHWSKDTWIGEKDAILSRLVKSTCALFRESPSSCG